MSERTNIKEKAIALSNRDIQAKLDLITNDIIGNKPIKAMNKLVLLNSQIKELQTHLKFLCQNHE